MYSSWIKRVSALLLAGLMMLSLVACGEAKEDAADAMTKEEYQQAVATLGEDMQEVVNRAAEVDTTDEGESTAVLEELKAPLEEFVTIVPPESYAAGHEKVCEGCEALIDYIDIVISIIGTTDEEALNQAAEQMETAAEKATTALQEGDELLQQADETE